MDKAANVVQITPFMHVPDLAGAIRWFELIGFETILAHGGYAYMGYGQARIRVMESRQDDGAPNPPHRGFAYYIDVRDVGAIARDLAPKLTAAGVEFMGPRDQTYGQREFMIRAPDGNVFVFGQSLEG